MEDFNLLIYLGLFFLISQIFGRLANFLKSPRLIGYLLAGIVFGPHVLDVFSEEIVKHMELFTEMALAIIAFSIGASLKLEEIRSKKSMIIGIALFQAVTVALVVAASSFLALYFFSGKAPIKDLLACSVILGAIAVATAPAAILSIIHEYRAHGSLTNILVGVIAIDDGITLLFYAFAISMGNVWVMDTDFNFQSGILNPLLSIGYAIGLGLVVGIFIKLIGRYFQKEELLMGILLGAVFLVAGLAEMFDFSHLLPIMIFGFFIENFTQHDLAKKSYNAIDKIEEPILGIFFLLAGAHLDLTKASSAILFVLVVFFSRAISKYIATRTATHWSHAEEKVKKYLGWGLLPSAGVAIGLVLDAQSQLSTQIQDLSALMVSIILGNALLNELISPFILKKVLEKAGEIKKK